MGVVMSMSNLGKGYDKGEPEGPPLSRGDERRVVSQREEPITEHITDGSPCWCQPTAEDTGDGHVFVHREVVQ